MPLEKILTLDSTEKVVRVYHRSLVGLFPALMGLLLDIVVTAGAIYLISRFRPQVADVINPNLLTLIITVLGVLLVLVLYVSIVVYLRNRLALTNENIVIIRYHSLFGRKISQLSLAKIQDVSVSQIGIFAHIFDFGTVTIETAGEEANFTFELAKSPTELAKVIIEAHEVFVAANPGTPDF